VTAGGAVVAAHPAAAEAGAGALAARGSAVDAAIAAAFALTVVDAGNCGVGGYGGFLIYAPPSDPPVTVDFNTWVPDGVGAERLRPPGDQSPSVDGGRAVAPPVVVQGLLAAHDRFGRLPRADLVAPAVRLARDGFPVGRDLRRALVKHWERTGGGNPSFASIFFPDGAPPEVGATLVQPDLAETLAAVAADGADVFRSGVVVDAVCDAVAADGGFLRPDDFLREPVEIGPSASVAFASATVHGPPPETSGAGVLFAALAAVETDALGPNRGPGYVTELARALAAAWGERTETARRALQARHTTTLCAADPDGGLAALTFTHGTLLFGSGLVAPGTGVVLNAGANLFAAGPGGPRAVTNMSPIVIEQAHGVRHALGATGGPRIPGLLLTAVVDVVHYGLPLGEAISAPHLSVRASDGALEAEPKLLEAVGGGIPLGQEDFGPAAGITRTARGCVAAVDPRFDSGVATV
jgi:gamma-glutamyltranspeptidase/glutathione hydrolase